MAERVGFEPTCPVKDQPISSRCRYDRFGTSPGNSNFQYRAALARYSELVREAWTGRHRQDSFFTQRDHTLLGKPRRQDAFSTVKALLT